MMPQIRLDYLSVCCIQACVESHTDWLLGEPWVFKWLWGVLIATCYV